VIAILRCLGDGHELIRKSGGKIATCPQITRDADYTERRCLAQRRKE